MSKRTLPDTAWSDDLEIDSSEWNKFEAAAATIFSEDDRKIIAEAINKYFVGWCFYIYTLDKRQVKKRLAPVRRCAKKLFLLLEKFDLFETLEDEDVRDLLNDMESADPPEFFDLDIDIHNSIALQRGRMSLENISLMKAIIGSNMINFDDSISAYRCIFDMRSALQRFIEIIELTELDISSETGAHGDPYLSAFLYDILYVQRISSGHENISSEYYSLVLEIAKFITIHAEKLGKNIRLPVASLCDLSADEFRANQVKDVIRHRIAAYAEAIGRKR